MKLNNYKKKFQSSILKRFGSGGISFGAISEKSHRELAKGFFLAGARSNTGEGGEASDRYNIGNTEKIVNSYVPEKVKNFIEKNLLEELKYFQKKYAFEVKILSDHNLIIPEYKIDLLNKSKKLIKTIENINSIIQIDKTKNSVLKKKRERVKENVKTKEKIKKTKSKKKVRTLWVRRKKKR